MAKQTRNRRESVTSRLRLRDYDYATPAFYFVSICCQNRAFMFGDMSGEEMIPNPAGKMVDGNLE